MEERERDHILKECGLHRVIEFQVWISAVIYLKKLHCLCLSNFIFKKLICIAQYQYPDIVSIVQELIHIFPVCMNAWIRVFMEGWGGRVSAVVFKVKKVIKPWGEKKNDFCTPCCCLPTMNSVIEFYMYPGLFISIHARIWLIFLYWKILIMPLSQFCLSWLKECSFIKLDLCQKLE